MCVKFLCVGLARAHECVAKGIQKVSDFLEL